ncbi:MAG: MFS transporter [Candidatus Sulfopaludibacter sp.]|nr:MFS transporter [Candidatus Sulfopaludibacter sp.]
MKSKCEPLVSLAVLFLVNVLNIYDRQVLSAVVEPLRRDFHLSDTQLGLLPALFTVLYAVAGLPLGRAADTGSRRRLLAVGIAVWAVLTALGAAAMSYGALLATRLGVGIGEAVCAPAATSWIADVVPAVRRARAMAGFMMAVPVGIMLSLAISGPVAQAYGWRAAMTLAAVPAMALVPAVLWLPEPARAASPTQPAPSYSFLRLRAFWWIAASGAIVNSALYSFSYFLPAFLTRVHGLTVGQAGLWTGIGSGAAGIAGAVGAGLFGDNRRMGRMRLAAVAALLAAPPIFAALRLPVGSAPAVTALAMLGYGLLQTYYGLVYAALHDVVAPALRGTAMAAYLMVSYLCGASFGPVLTGRLSDHFARSASAAGLAPEAARAVGLHHAMYVIPALCVALAVVLWQGAGGQSASLPS